MKTEAQLDQDILDITMKIQAEFPELAKFVQEIPIKISGENIEDLEKYHNSLKTLLNEYTETHKQLNECKENGSKKTSSSPIIYPPFEDIFRHNKNNK